MWDMFKSGLVKVKDVLKGLAEVLGHEKKPEVGSLESLGYLERQAAAKGVPTFKHPLRYIRGSQATEEDKAYAERAALYGQGKLVQDLAKVQWSRENT